MFEKINDYLEQLMQGDTPDKSRFNVEMTKEGKSPAWNYIDGVACKAILDLYDVTKNEKYLKFVDKYIGWYISEDGSILGFNKEKYNIDSINCGNTLYKLYDYTKKEKYRKAIDVLYDQIKTHPRLAIGNFFHKKIYPYQVWLDGIYMGLPFYMRYETRYDNLNGYLDIHNQIMNVDKIMVNKKTGLPAHAYDESRQSFWCDKETGLSHNNWSRSLGWYIMALIDIIEDMNEMMYEQKRDYMSIFRKTIDALLKYADSKTGMLYQVTDMGDREGNYLETSASAMLAYAVLKGVRLHVLPQRYSEAGKKTFNGIMDTYFKEENGKYTLGGICLVAGLGPENNRKRDGSYEYYISEPIVENDGKGLGPFLLAYVEMLRARD